MARFRKTLAGAVALTLALLMGAASAQACTKDRVAKAERTYLPTSRIDQKLFSRAVLAEVNWHRCRNGLAPLADKGGLAKVAATHSQWMAKARKLDHKSGVRGQQTLGPRLKAAGVKFRKGAENIGYAFRYGIDRNGGYRRADLAQCNFTGHDGQQIPAHTYASFANWIVHLWMNSPGHRKNILTPQFKLHGSGVAFDAKEAKCGKFYATQSLAG